MTDVDEYLTEVDGSFPDEDPQPLDVRVVAAVEPIPEPLHTAVAARRSMGQAGVPVALVTKLPDRVAVVVRNRTSGPIYVDGTAQLTAGTGYQLDAGESLTLDRVAELYAVSALTNPGDVHVLSLV